MKYKIAVCDDEEQQIQYLAALARDWANGSGKKAVIRPFFSAEEFLFQYEDEKDYDVLLLDIEMGNTNGVELAKRIREENDAVQIVFITGYPDFIAEGYEPQVYGRAPPHRQCCPQGYAAPPLQCAEKSHAPSCADSPLPCPEPDSASPGSQA